MADAESVNLSWHIWVGVISTIIPATLLVGLRFFARVQSRAGLKADDWLILAALVVNWAMAAIRFYEVLHLGYGHHAYTLPTSMVSDFQKSFLAVQEAYFINSLLTKSSILYMYYRIFGVSRRFTINVWIAFGLICCFFIICVTASIAGCSPVSYFWNKQQQGYCFDEVNFFRGNGIANMLLDIYILFLPLPMVWRLQLRVQQKIVLTAIFSLGLFVVLTSIFRIVQFQKSRQVDPTYTTVDSGMWSSIEQSMGLVCACLPTLRPIFRSLGWDNSTKQSNSYQNERNSRTLELHSGARPHNSRLQHHSSETESVIGFAKDSDGSLKTRETANELDEDVSEDNGRVSPGRGPLVIMKTSEVHQSSSASSMRNHTRDL